MKPNDYPLTKRLGLEIKHKPYANNYYVNEFVVNAKDLEALLEAAYSEQQNDGPITFYLKLKPLKSECEHNSGRFKNVGFSGTENLVTAVCIDCGIKLKANWSPA